MRILWNSQGWLGAIMLVTVVLGACITGPFNGAVVDGEIVNKSFSFQGYTPSANDHIVLEVLDTPSADYMSDANWSPFGDAWSASTPINVLGDPFYPWSTVAIPVPPGKDGRWPSGGLIRMRALVIGANGERLNTITFDEVTASRCFDERADAGDGGYAIGLACGGLGGSMVAMVSTKKSPATLPAEEKPDWLGRKGDHADQKAKAYYDAWGAPKTFSLFKSRYGFSSDDITATYYNDGDLGLGREMHCRRFLVDKMLGVACYVINYTGIDNTPAFDVNPDIVLADAIAHKRSYATVAMVYTPLTNNPNDPNDVKFVVYGKDEQQALQAQLDSRKAGEVGAHVSIPNNCLSCHGISSTYDDTLQQIRNAKFLPFDPFSYTYSTQKGYTLNDQQEKFRQLNSLVNLTSPTLAISELIAGMYSPNLVTTPGAVANNTYVPGPWRDADESNTHGSSTYLGIIKPGCRTCHISATTPGLDFPKPDDWMSWMPWIRPDVCAKTKGTQKGHSMPQAERASKKFWASGGRAYLMTGYPVYPPDGLEACDP